jgi:hypothetical protein
MSVSSFEVNREAIFKMQTLVYVIDTNLSEIVK